MPELKEIQMNMSKEKILEIADYNIGICGQQYDELQNEKECLLNMLADIQRIINRPTHAIDYEDGKGITGLSDKAKVKRIVRLLKFKKKK